MNETQHERTFPDSFRAHSSIRKQRVTTRIKLRRTQFTCLYYTLNNSVPERERVEEITISGTTSIPRRYRIETIRYNWICPDSESLTIISLIIVQRTVVNICTVDEVPSVLDATLNADNNEKARCRYNLSLPRRKTRQKCVGRTRRLNEDKIPRREGEREKERELEAENMSWFIVTMKPHHRQDTNTT